MTGGVFKARSVQSTGVTGLTATIDAGVFAIGSGTLTYQISGIPIGSGMARFAISIGGQACILERTVSAYPEGTIHCGGAPTAVVDINSTTGRVWMDRNLGATRVAQSSTDAAAFGDL